MKKLSVLILGTIAFVSCTKANKIEVTTKDVADGTKVEVVVRDEVSTAPTTLATAEVKDGKVSFDNPFEEADEAFIVIGEDQGSVVFIGEPGNITVEYNQAEPTQSKIAGTENNLLMQQLQDAMKPQVEKVMAFMNDNGLALMQLSESENPEDQQKLLALQEQYTALSTDLENTMTKFKEDNPSSLIALMLLNQEIMQQDKSLEESQAAFDKFPMGLRSSKIGKKITATLKDMAAHPSVSLKIGDKVPDFKGKTPEGAEVSLYEYLKGKKVVLVDLWAAWCGPCRMENPNLVKTYEEFHKDGFDIIGYSLDRKSEDWVAAIAKDKLTWMQVSNLLYWDDPIVGAYGIQGIPASFLVDEHGTILDRDLRGSALGKKVAELLKK